MKNKKMKSRNRGNYTNADSYARIKRDAAIGEMQRGRQRAVVEIISWSGRPGRTWPSIRDAAAALGIAEAIVHKMCHERTGYETYRGLVLRFATQN